MNIFDQEYKKLNKAQKEAVDTIEGPVMVVAGPGTGKTQILALRIGNILLQTDTKADSMLCLTFTNSAVKAMRERLRRYIGPEAAKVNVSTFHSFGLDIIDTYYEVLGLDEKPTLMDDSDTIALYDEVLQNNTWEYLRTRSSNSRYFRDLKSFISFLKRERITADSIEDQVNTDIKYLAEDPTSISSRGESKGKLKKEVEKKIEGLNRTLEAVKFYRAYEAEKKEKNAFDYDDILEALVYIVEESEDAKNYIKENFLYVLIDEHQDSSGVQNEFLSKVWHGEERPNIFVVGDDRQLIYGFGGASLEYFENFKHAFGEARLITLVENYRSTEHILNSSHALLQSSLTKEELKSNHKENYPVRLVEAYYERDEIIAISLEIKEKIKKGENPDTMAILVPKNRHVRSAVSILKDMDILVASTDTINFFDSDMAQSLLRVLSVIAYPENGDALAASFFDVNSGISPIKAHTFIKAHNMREFSLLSIEPEKNTLFAEENEVNAWIEKLKGWLAHSSDPLYSLIQKVGSEFLLEKINNHEELVLRIEVIRTLLHLVLLESEKNPDMTLKEFLNFLGRVREYGEHIPLAVFAPHDGVKVLTLHGSKGLEFDSVWIAHMDEKSFSGTKRDGFTLPESVKNLLSKRDEIVLKRELYVAITRAKRFCTISYAIKSYTGGDQEVSHTVLDIADNFEKQNADETEKLILKNDSTAYVKASTKNDAHVHTDELVTLVKRDYENRKVSVSLLNNFFECPWKWYFRNLLQLPELKSESLEFGNIVHGSIDQVLKLSKKPSDADIENIVKYQIKKSQFGDKRKQAELFKQAYAVVVRWAEERLPEINSQREPEQSVSVSDDRFPHLSIYGKIDLIEHIGDNTIRVIDFKTGGAKKKGDIEKIDEHGKLSNYMRQLAMYSYLITHSPKWKVRVTESWLEFLEAKNKSEVFYKTVITDEHINMVVGDIKEYDEQIKSGEWIDRPCEYNSYGKNTQCEYCKIAQIYK